MAKLEHQESSTLSTSNTTPLTPLQTLQSADGYYTYLKIPPPPKEIDLDLVQKNYRRLSLRHHPDRKEGDADTFRVLNRAKKVLTNEKLRKQYDLLGLDLMDEEEKEEGQGDAAAEDAPSSAQSSTSDSHESVVSHLASATLASILQALVRTVILCLLSTLLSRFKITVVLVNLFFFFLAHRIHSTSSPSIPIPRYLSAMPAVLGVSVVGIHIARLSQRTRWFTAAECCTITLILFSSVHDPTLKQPASLPHLAKTLGLCSVPAFFLALFLKGSLWRYGILLGVEVMLAILAVLVFPVMEMIIEQVLREKMKKIGEKVRSWQGMQMEVVVGQQNRIRELEGRGQNKN